MSASWILTGASVTGPGHLRERMPNQDAYLNRRMRGGFIAVVCDGMGSRPFSGFGAKCACRVSRNILASANFSIDSRSLITTIRDGWLNALGDIDPNDAATTCLICWGNSIGEVRYFQLGDGRIIAPEMEYSERVSFTNETTGLGVSHTLDAWTEGAVTLARGQGIVMMTDGISEDLEEGSEQAMLKSLLRLAKYQGPRRAKKSIVRELNDWPTPSHLDDKTISIIVRR